MEKMTNAKALEYVLETYDIPSDVSAKLDSMLASLKKKSANRKPTKTQEENEGLKSIITDVLTTEGKTPSEIIASTSELTGLTPQKVSPLCYQLVASGVAKKITDKKRTLFALA